MKRILLFTFISLTIVSCNKYEKSIERINSMIGTDELNLVEGWKEGKIQLVDDSLINYIVESNHFKNITRLKIDNCPEISIEGYKKLRELKKLEIIRLYNLPINSKTLNTFILNPDSFITISMYNLENIDSVFIKSSSGFLDIDFEECENLKYIGIENSSDYLSVGLSECLKDKNLVLELKNCKYSYINLFREKITNNFHIKSDTSKYTLSFMRCDLNESDQTFFSSFKTADRLILDINKKDLLISDLVYLKELKIESFFTNYDNPEPYVEKVHLLNLPALEELTIISDSLHQLKVDKLDSLDLAYITTHNPNFDLKSSYKLQNLQYLYMVGIKTKDKLLEEFMNLPKLHFFYYLTDTLTNNQLNQIAESLTLEHLEINSLRDTQDLNTFLGMENITDLSVSSSVLESVRINSHHTLEQFEFSGNALKELEIISCPNLISISADHSYPNFIILSDIPSIESLNFALCDLNDLNGFIQKINSFSTLSSLEFEICNYDASLDFRALNKLHYLRLTNGIAKRLIINKAVEDSIYLNDYKGAVQFVDY